MPLTIKPPRPPSEQPSTAAGIAIEKGPDSGAAGSQSQPTSSSNDGSSSPVAPAYSPITPKVQPALPVVGHGNDNNVFDVPPVPPGPEVDSHLLPDVSMDDAIPPSERAPFSHPLTAGKAPIPPSAPSAIPETQYIPPPPSQPFSSDDSADAIALRAAISALQFQKQKAQGDLQTLEALKQHAAREPERFRRELVAGKLKEERPHFGAIRDVLEASAGDEEDDDDEVVLGAQEERELPASRTGIEPGSGSQQGMSPGQQKEQAPFPKIPGPQDIVRMPPVNWEKYHIVGEGLDALHEQQRRWPGSVPGQENRGREHAVAAPYSPFYDTLEAQAQGLRKGSAGAGAGEQAGETKRAGKS